MIFVVLFAFLAGLEGILDQWEFHQPILACSLIGLAAGHPAEGIALGGSLQMIALGWANIGAAVAPDAALASVASTIIMVQTKQFGIQAILGTVIPIAILLATAGLVLTTLVRFINVGTIHLADAQAEKGSYAGVSFLHLFALLLQGLRIAIPAGIILAIPAAQVTAALNAIPDWLRSGLAIGGGMVVVVGYAMVISLMATRELWPFFFLGFALAPVTQITLIGIGILGVVIGLVYLTLQNSSGGGGGVNAGDPIGDILNDY
jgi:PTS system mannose-specific IIC component